MPERPEELVPESVAGQLEALVQGKGPFEDAEEEFLLQSEAVDSPDIEPEEVDRREQERIRTQERLDALEQALLSVPGIPEPLLLPDQNVEFGLIDAFTGPAATATVTPCDKDGNVTGESDVTVYVKTDRTNATVGISDQAVVTWERFDERTTSGTVGGVLVGALLSDVADTDKLVAHKSGQTPNYLATVLQITPANNLLYTDGGATYNLSHDIPWCCAYCLPGMDNIEIDSTGHVGYIWCGAVCCGPGWRCT